MAEKVYNLIKDRETPVQATSEIKRILKPGAQVFVMDLADSFSVEYSIIESEMVQKKYWLTYNQ